MAKDPNEKWADATRLYDRQLWKGPAPTQRGRSPLNGRGARRKEGAERRRFRVFTPSAMGAEGGSTAPSNAEEPRERKAASEAAPALSFKPLNELTEQVSAQSKPENSPQAEPEKPPQS